MVSRAEFYLAPEKAACRKQRSRDGAWQCLPQSTSSYLREFLPRSIWSVPWYLLCQSSLSSNNCWRGWKLIVPKEIGLSSTLLFLALPLWFDHWYFNILEDSWISTFEGILLNYLYRSRLPLSICSFFFVKINQLWPIDYVWFETIKESQAPDTYLAWEHENVCKTEMTWRLLMGLWTQKTFIHHNDRFCIDASFLQINGMCKYSKNFGAMIWCSKGTFHFESQE